MPLLVLIILAVFGVVSFATVGKFVVACFLVGLGFLVAAAVWGSFTQQ